MTLVITDRLPIGSAAGRTSLLVNLAGIFVQQKQKRPANGVALAPLRQVLANVVWDWITIAQHEARFKFRMPGDLVWLPDTSGAVAHLVPSTDYPATRQHECYIDLLDLMKSGVFKVFEGTRGRITKTGDKVVVFVPFSDERIVGRNNVDSHEERHWTTLSQIYGDVLRESPESLEVMATCRTAQATFLSAFRHLLEWSDALERYLMAMIRPDELEPPIDIESFAVAKNSIDLFALRLDQHQSVERCAQIVRSHAVRTELHSIVPAMQARPEEDLYRFKVQALRGKASVITAVQVLCGELQALATTDGANLERVEEAARYLAWPSVGTLTAEEREPTFWQTVFGGYTATEAARVCGGLLGRVLLSLNRDTDFIVESTADFYARVSTELHPLYPHPKLRTRNTITNVLPKRPGVPTASSRHTH